MPQNKSFAKKTMESQNTLQLKARYQLETFLSDCKVENPNGKKILEIGFKNGLFLNECNKAGLTSTGIEINEDHYKNTKSKYPDLDIVLYDGGTIPTPDESFDFVVSFQVLEHVTSIEHIFSECVRILRPGGIMYHICPNFHSFYEGHSRLIWLPFLNKTMGRIYLKMLRRYTAGYEHLNIVKPKNVSSALQRHRDNLEIVSLGQAEFINKFNAEQIEKVDQRTLQKALKLLLRFDVLKKYTLGFVCRTNLYYPITVIAKKIHK
ncbi:MAG: class I SAM-dependent methyltransferase [Planctomycetes bacterium]|nr:class I SAM-dependent methyltransferase [Planctomycetota bacterium]